MERRLNKIRDPKSNPEALPNNCVNILMITARPYEEKDVNYRSISKPFVDLIEKEKLPANVHILRPPTFENLSEHLKKHDNFYHIIHFDGHGGYGHLEIAGDNSYKYSKEAEGCLVFEKENGKEDLVSAERIGDLLTNHNIPIVVLNACQSGMIDEYARDQYSSVSSALLKSGVRSVVANAYSIYVSAVKEFIPSFYKELFNTGSVSKAVYEGRMKMRVQNERICSRGSFKLDDWMVPVLYQQSPFELKFLEQAKLISKKSEIKLPEEALDNTNPYGLIGRDREFLWMERELRKETPAVLITGLGGVGKTTLAKGFVDWLDKTDGLGLKCFWFTFTEYRTAEPIINNIGYDLFGTNFGTLKTDEKLNLLANALKENKFTIVWDNFEVVKGIEEAKINPNLSNEDCNILLSFLSAIRNGKTKVIITSRCNEDWLGIERIKLPIRGLTGEDRWEFCEKILTNLGKKVDRDDKSFRDLMDMLDGHPLAMRVILPRLEKMTPSQVIDALKSNISALDLPVDDIQAKLFATLKFVEDSLPDALKEFLIPLALHEGYIEVAFLKTMAERVNGKECDRKVDDFINALSNAGLLHLYVTGIYEIHPILTSYLQQIILPSSDEIAKDKWIRAFVGIMADFANYYVLKELHEQKLPFHIHGANFNNAYELADRSKMLHEIILLIESKASFARNMRNFDEAVDLYNKLADICKRNEEYWSFESAAYHMLAMIAEEQRDFKQAEKWYRKSLEISERIEDESLAASTYHQLGMIAEKQQDFPQAEKWYRKSLEIKERLGNEHGAASTYHQLGRIAEEQRDFKQAEKWYGKSLEISERLKDESFAASTYHQLGIIAEEQRDFPQAEKWYRKSLEIDERLGNEHGAAITYHQLGMIARAAGFPPSGEMVSKVLGDF